MFKLPKTVFKIKITDWILNKAYYKIDEFFNEERNY